MRIVWPWLRGIVFIAMIVLGVAMTASFYDQRTSGTIGASYAITLPLVEEEGGEKIHLLWTSGEHVGYAATLTGGLHGAGTLYRILPGDRRYPLHDFFAPAELGPPPRRDRWQSTPAEWHRMVVQALSITTAPPGPTIAEGPSSN